MNLMFYCITGPYFPTEPGASTRGPGSSWEHRSRPPDPWEAPQNVPSAVPSSQTWRSPAVPGMDILLTKLNTSCVQIIHRYTCAYMRIMLLF